MFAAILRFVRIAKITPGVASKQGIEDPSEVEVPAGQFLTEADNSSVQGNTIMGKRLFLNIYLLLVLIATLSFSSSHNPRSKE